MIRMAPATLVLAALALAPIDAEATEDRKKVHDLKDGMQIDVNVYAGLDIVFSFPTRVLSAVPGNSNDYDVRLDDKLATLITNANPGITSLHIKLEGGESVAMLLLPVSMPAGLTLSHVFRYPPPPMPDVMPLCEPVPLLKPAEPPVLEVMDGRFEIESPLQATFAAGGHHLVMQTTQRVYEGETAKFRIRIRNEGTRSYPVAQTQILNSDMVEFRQDDIQIGDIPEHLGPNRESEASVVIRDPDALGTEWVLRLLPGVAGVPPAVLRVTPMQTTWPTPATQSRGPLQGRLVVVIRALTGATNLDDGPNVGSGTGRTGWALMRGIGGHASYGRFKHVSFGGGVDVATTETISLDAIQSAATGMRVHGSARVYAGRRLMPYARAGLGVAVAQHSFEAADATESELRLAGMLLLGGGVDWFITRRFLFGLDLGANVPLGGQETGLAFEAGLRAGVMFGQAR